MNEKMTVIAIFLALLPALDLFVRIIFGKNNNFFPFSKKLLQHDTNKKPLDLTFYFIALNFFRLFVIFIISMAIVSYLDTISGTLVFELLSVEYFVILTVFVIVFLPVSLSLNVLSNQYIIFRNPSYIDKHLLDISDILIFLFSGALAFVLILCYILTVNFLFALVTLFMVVVSILHDHFFGKFLFVSHFDFEILVELLKSDEDFIIPSIIVWNYVAPFRYFLSLFQVELFLMSYAACKTCSYHFVYDAIVYVGGQQVTLYAFIAEIENSSSWSPFFQL